MIILFNLPAHSRVCRVVWLLNKVRLFLYPRYRSAPVYSPWSPFPLVNPPYNKPRSEDVIVVPTISCFKAETIARSVNCCTVRSVNRQDSILGQPFPVTSSCSELSYRSLRQIGGISGTAASLRRLFLVVSVVTRLA